MVSPTGVGGDNMISTDDWVQINDVVSRYFWAIDEADGPAWAQLWTEDGVLMEPGRQAVRGHAALTETAGMVKQHFGRGMRHTVSNLVCDYAGEDRDRVTAKFYSHVTLYEQLSGTFGMALCQAEFVRQGGAWKIASNTVDFLVPKGQTLG
jgi:hypothetical protein